MKATVQVDPGLVTTTTVAYCNSEIDVSFGNTASAPRIDLCFDMTNTEIGQSGTLAETGQECVFWDENAAKWSPEGLEFVSLEGNTVCCRSKHLSILSVAVTAPLTPEPTPTPSPPPTAAVTPKPTPQPTEMTREAGKSKRKKRHNTQRGGPPGSASRHALPFKRAPPGRAARRVACALCMCVARTIRTGAMSRRRPALPSTSARGRGQGRSVYLGFGRWLPRVLSGACAARGVGLVASAPAAEGRGTSPSPRTSLPRHNRPATDS